MEEQDHIITTVQDIIGADPVDSIVDPVTDGEPELDPALFDRQPLATYLAQLNARGLLGRVATAASLSLTTVRRAMQARYTVSGENRKQIYLAALEVETQEEQIAALRRRSTRPAGRAYSYNPGIETEVIEHALRMGIRYPCGRTYHIYGSRIFFDIRHWMWEEGSVLSGIRERITICPKNLTGLAYHIEEEDLVRLGRLVGLDMNVWSDQSVR